jgi:hypothetical protein
MQGDIARPGRPREPRATLETTAFAGAGTQAYVCCECILYGCNNDAR